MEIWAIRHPISIDNELEIHQGQDPNAPGLSEKGFEQAFRIARFLRNFRVLKIWSSPLLRTMQLARMIKNSCDPLLSVIEEPGLMEMTNGVVDGLLLSEMKERFPEGWRAWKQNVIDRPCYLGGESKKETAKRGVATLRKIARLSFPLPENYYELDNIVVAVSHGTLLHLTLASLNRVNLRNHQKFIAQNNGCINFLRWSWMGLEATYINFTGHLGDTDFSPKIEL